MYDLEKAIEEKKKQINGLLSAQVNPTIYFNRGLLYFNSKFTLNQSPKKQLNQSKIIFNLILHLIFELISLHERTDLLGL